MCVYEPITLYDNKARYLGVTLCSGKCFGVDLRSTKSNFYSSFNSIFHSAASYQNELVVLHLVYAYSKPSLAVNIWTLTLRRYGVSNIHGKLLYHIFFIYKGADVRNECNKVTDAPLDCHYSLILA